MTEPRTWASPYGQAGDRLWVRETWAVANYKGQSVGPYVADAEEVVYRADGFDLKGRWRPSIHMPRIASRIDLLIKQVRVERLQQISTDDAVAEGIKELQGGATVEFMNLWDSINAKRGFGWATNPWVWVIEFDRIRS